jgi:hypothetical protein
MIFEAGLIDMGLIFMLGYLGYVFANVLKFPFNDYFQVRNHNNCSMFASLLISI